MKIKKFNESVEHPYMFQYNCNNSTFGYDFQCYAQKLGAHRMYDHTQRGGGLHFYTVPSEEVYNKLKEVAKKKFTVDMHPLRPFDKEKFANAKIQEAVNTHKLNESMSTEDEFFEIEDIIGNALNSIGGDMDNITGDIAVNGDEDIFTMSLYSTVNKKDARNFKRKFFDTIEKALSSTRFNDVSADENYTFAYQLSENDLLNYIGPRAAKEFQDKFVMFEILITAYGTRLEEAMTIAYDQKTIDNQIKVIEKNLEDYKKLVIEEPDDKEYWQEQIKKCQDEIADLKSYKPLDESFKHKVNEAWDDTETIRAAYDSYIEDCAWKQEEPISFEKFRDNYIGDKEESEEEFNSRMQYWAVYATDKATGKEYCAGVYESKGWANYWAGMDRSADAEYGYGNFDYRIEQVSEYNEEMDNSKSELNNLKLRNYDNRNMTESVKRLGAGGRKLTESKKGFLCKYKGCSIHDMGDVFVATNSTGLNIGQSKTKAGIEGIIDEYVADRSKSDPIKEDTNSRGFYVTTYSPDERWSPEEGGTMDYGWDANRSKFFRTEQEAQAYLDDKLVGCNITSKYDGSYQYEDEYGDKHMIAIEPFHKRGQWHAPARSWAQIEFDDPVERPYFDRKGDRLARNPRLVAKEKRAAAELEREFLSIIDSATTRKEFIDSISDIKYSNLFSKHITTINDKWKSLKESAPICSESSEDATLDVKMMDLEKVPSILNWDIADKLQDYFRENKLWVDELHYNQVQDRIEFDINWGDWKHEHLRAKWLLQELFEKLGIEAGINSHTTEEDGSDTYSAHYNVYAIKE